MIAKTDCALVAAADVALTAPAVATLGGTRVSNLARALMIGQTLPAQNGIYVAEETGEAILTGSEEFEGLGTCVVSGLTAGLVYSWRKGDYTTELVNGTESLFASGWFVAAGTSVTLVGDIEEDLLDYLYLGRFARATDADEPVDFAESFTVQIGTALYFWEYDPEYVLGTSALNFSAISTNPAAPWTPDTTDPTTNPATV